MSTPYRYELFSPAEGAEAALFQIFSAQGIPAQKRFETRTNDTPRVELQFVLGAPVHRHVLDTDNINAQAQPFDAWQYQLLATITTERTRNGNQHVPLIGKTRYNLQYFRLLETFTDIVAPYHAITSIEEVNQLDSVDDPNNLQMTQLTFRGILNIRESAWWDSDLMFEPSGDSMFTPSSDLMFV